MIGSPGKVGWRLPLGSAQLAHLNKHNVREQHNTSKKLKRYATPGHAHELTFSCYHRFNCLYDATRCSLFLFDSLSLTFGYPSAGCSAAEPVPFHQTYEINGLNRKNKVFLVGRDSHNVSRTQRTFVLMGSKAKTGTRFRIRSHDIFARFPRSSQPGVRGVRRRNRSRATSSQFAWRCQCQ